MRCDPPEFPSKDLWMRIRFKDENFMDETAELMENKKSIV
jgi:hypothetical protein